MKNRNLPFATTQIDLEGIILSEISQTEAKHYVFEVSKKKRQISENNNNKTDCNVENQRGEGRGRGKTGVGY